MYSVVLVDDEYLELELLERQVQWESLGFTVVAAAKNGREGLEMVERFRPDVLITDVKMPFMDGIALAQQVYKYYPETRIIFLSGYNQFEYLKAAFHVEAVDYLLKPVDIDELHTLMRVVKSKCDAENQKKSNDITIAIEQVREILVLNSEDNWNKKADEFRQLFNVFFSTEKQNTDYCIALVTVDEISYITKYQDTCIFTINDFRMLFSELVEKLNAIFITVKEGVYLLISYLQPWEVIHDWKKRNEDVQEYITICFLEKPVHVSRIQSEYSRLCQLRDWHVHHIGTGHIKSADEIEQVIAYKKSAAVRMAGTLDRGLLLQFMQRGESAGISEWLAAFFNVEVEGNIYNRTFELLDYIYTVFVSPNKALVNYMEDKPKLFRHLTHIESISLLQDVTQTQILKLVNETVNKAEADPCQNIINSVQRYVEAHYHEQFTVEGLGEYLNYSPNYIRSIFKKYTGETLLEYITNLRMERATQMLQNTIERIRNISLGVGYSNPSYFCSQFFKRYGITPQQYRSRIKK